MPIKLLKDINYHLYNPTNRPRVLLLVCICVVVSPTCSMLKKIPMVRQNEPKYPLVPIIFTSRDVSRWKKATLKLIRLQ